MMGSLVVCKRTSAPTLSQSVFYLDTAGLEDPEAKQLSETSHWDLSLIEEIHQSEFIAEHYKN